MSLGLRATVKTLPGLVSLRKDAPQGALCALGSLAAEFDSFNRRSGVSWIG